MPDRGDRAPVHRRARLYQRKIREALLRDWDPIGIADVAEAADEYDAYVGRVYRLLISQAPAADIFHYLRQVETEQMGLRGDRQRTERVAERLLHIVKETESETG